ncbi:hypothetical protein D3C76_724250 [compost metagenome]
MPSLITACATYCSPSATGMRPWGGVTCSETMDVAPLPDSGCDDESSSPPPQAANNKATMDAHIHMNSCFIVSPNKLFNLYAWPPVLSSGQAPYCDAAETSLNHRDQAITRAHENERTGFTGLSSRVSCDCQRGHGVRQRSSEGTPWPGSSGRIQTATGVMDIPHSRRPGR